MKAKQTSFSQSVSQSVSDTQNKLYVPVPLIRCCTHIYNYGSKVPCHHCISLHSLETFCGLSFQ